MSISNEGSGELGSVQVVITTPPESDKQKETED